MKTIEIRIAGTITVGDEHLYTKLNRETLQREIAEKVFNSLSDYPGIEWIGGLSVQVAKP